MNEMEKSKLVYQKYNILDAETGEVKKGKYFVLRLDAHDPDERAAVRNALQTYANCQEQIGRTDFAKNICAWANNEPQEIVTTVAHKVGCKLCNDKNHDWTCEFARIDFGYPGRFRCALIHPDKKGEN